MKAFKISIFIILNLLLIFILYGVIYTLFFYQDPVGPIVNGTESRPISMRSLNFGFYISYFIVLLTNIIFCFAKVSKHHIVKRVIFYFVSLTSILFYIGSFLLTNPASPLWDVYIVYYGFFMKSARFAIGVEYTSYLMFLIIAIIFIVPYKKGFRGKNISPETHNHI